MAALPAWKRELAGDTVAEKEAEAKKMKPGLA